jgi:translocator protein
MKQLVCLSDIFCFKEKTKRQTDFILFIIKWIIILLPIVVGTSMGIIYGKKWDEEKYKNLKKPPLYPPNYLFSIVWPILYIMIGFTYYNILYNSGCIPYGYSKCGITIKYVKSIYLIIPTLALIFNFAYIPVFFSENGLFNGLVVIILALLFAVLTVIQTMVLYWGSFFNSYRIIIVLFGLVPYIAWLCFATYLSYNLYVLNKKEYMFNENYKNFKRFAK